MRKNIHQVLTENQVDQIDRAARALLRDPGVMVEDEEIYRCLLEAGASEGGNPLVVRIPEEMLDERLALAPDTVGFADRAGGMHRASPDSPSRFWTGAALFYLDRSGLRPTRQQDLADLARVVDDLEHVDAIVGTSTEETPPRHRDFVGFRIMAQNTRKHIRALSFTPKGGEAIMEMAEVLAGDRSLRDAPLFSIGFTAHGPLRWTSLALGVYKCTAGHGIPCTVNGEPMAGASAPVTLAGTAAVGTAEILAGIVINQLLEPGRPCLFNLGFAHVMDMRTGFAVTGGPENITLAVIGAQMARRYNLPSVSWMCTDSLDYDGQNALEKALACLAHAQARVSTVWGVGQVESEKTISPVQAAVDNEIIGMVRHYLAPVQVDEETLAVEEVRREGVTGSFLGTEHTFSHFRDIVYEPELLVRKQRAGAGERDSLRARAEDAVGAVLFGEREPLLTPEEEREILAIEQRYAEFL